MSKEDEKIVSRMVFMVWGVVYVPILLLIAAVSFHGMSAYGFLGFALCGLPFLASIIAIPFFLVVSVNKVDAVFENPEAHKSDYEVWKRAIEKVKKHE